MNSIKIILIYILTFIGIYFVLSLLVMLFNGHDYLKAISSVDWFGMYTIFIGWWVALFPAYEMYQSNLKKEEERDETNKKNSNIINNPVFRNVDKRDLTSYD